MTAGSVTTRMDRAAQWDAIEHATERRTRTIRWVLGTAITINGTLLVGVLAGVVGVTVTGSWP